MKFIEVTDDNIVLSIAAALKLGYPKWVVGTDTLGGLRLKMPDDVYEEAFGDKSDDEPEPEPEPEKPPTKKAARKSAAKN